MSISCLINHAKNKLFPPAPAIGLSEFIEQHDRSFGYWLRPANDLQSQQMVGAYLKAFKDDLKNGGYIFVKKSRAPDVFRQLNELDTPYKAVHLKKMEYLSDIVQFSGPKALMIFVEDDSLPYETLSSRFRVAETALRAKMAPALGTRVDEPAMREALEALEARGRTLVMFIEMDYPSMKGFSVIQSQCRSLRIATCIVSKANAHDYELNAIFNQPEHSPDELRCRAANTFRIFGSGPKHRAEFTQAFHGHIEGTQLGSLRALSQEALSIDLGRLTLESNLAFAFGFDEAEILDLTK